MKKDIVKLALWGIVLVVLILGIMILNRSKDSDDTSKKTAQKIFQLKGESIVKVKLQKVLGTIVCEKKDNQWQIIKPKKYASNHKAIDRLSQVFMKLESIKFLTDSNLSKFGLAKPKESFSFWIQDEKKYTLYKGNKVPGESSFYVRTNLSKEVYTLSDRFMGSQGLGKRLNDLRDKDFLKLKENQLTTIHMKDFILVKSDVNITKLDKLPEGIDFKDKLSGKTGYNTDNKQLIFKGKMSKEEKDQLDKLSKDKVYQEAVNNLFEASHKDKWILKSSPTDQTNLQLTTKLINDVLNIKAIGFVDKLNRQKEIRFNQKEVRIIAHTGKSRIQLSMVEYGSKVYAKKSNKPQVYEITKSLFDSVNKGKSYYLKKEKSD